MSDGNTDSKNKKIKEPILNMGLGESILLIFKITFVIFFICSVYVGVTTLSNTQPIAKTFAKASGYLHYDNNREIFSQQNIDNFFKIYIDDENDLTINELELYSVDFQNYGIGQGNMASNRLYELSEEQFAQFITYSKVIDSADGKVADSPCQLYSYLWSNYYDYNDYTYKYHFIKGHTFLIVEKPFGYSIVEQQDIIDVHLDR